MQTQAFIRAEEEKLVAQDGASHNSTEVVLLNDAARFAGSVEIPVIGVEHRVAKVIEPIAVEFVGSGAGNQRNLPAWCPAKLRSKAGSGDTKLLEVIERDQIVVSAGSRSCGLPAGSRGSQRTRSGGGHIAADSIHGKVAGICALAVDHKLPAAGACRRHRSHARSQRNQALKTAPVQWHVGHVTPLDNRSHRGILRVELLGARVDRHRLIGSADLQGYGERNAILDKELNALRHTLAEARRTDRELILPRRQGREYIVSRSIAARGAGDTRERVGCFHGRAGNDRA